MAILSAAEQVERQPHRSTMRVREKACPVLKVSRPRKPLGHQEFDCRPVQLVPMIAEHPFRLGIHQDDRAARVDDNNAIRRGFEEAPERLCRPRGSGKSRSFVGFRNALSDVCQMHWLLGNNAGWNESGSSRRERKARFCSAVSACSRVGSFAEWSIAISFPGNESVFSIVINPSQSRLGATHSIRLGTPHKTARRKGTVPVLLRGLRKMGTVPGGFVRGSRAA